MNKKKNSQKPSKLIHPTQAELAKMVAKARAEAQEANYDTENIKSRLQEIIDEANMVDQLIPYIRPQEAEGLIGIWSSVASQVSSIKSNLHEIYPTTDSAGGTATVSSTIISGSYTNDRLYSDNPDFQNAWIPYVEYASRPSQRENVVQLLKEFSLDVSHKTGEKSPLDLFETAHEAYARPITQSNPVSTSLIPLRGCIDNAVQSLLLMRPQQEVTGSWKKKIISIGKQLRKDSLPNEVIDELAEECHSLINDLSGAKTRDISREDWLI